MCVHATLCCSEMNWLDARKMLPGHVEPSQPRKDVSRARIRQCCTASNDPWIENVCIKWEEDLDTIVKVRCAYSRATNATCHDVDEGLEDH